MDDAYDAIEQYELALPTFNHVELGRIDYANIVATDYRLLNKIMMSLITTALPYEQSTLERLQTWLIPVGVPLTTTQGVVVHHTGCLSNNDLFSLRQLERITDNDIRSYSISKSLLHLPLLQDALLNFFTYYALFPSIVDRYSFWNTLLSQARPSIRTAICQVLPEETRRLRDLLVGSPSDKDTLLIISAFLQISLALIQLDIAAEGTLYLSSITVDDILIIPFSNNAPAGLDYGKLGIVQHHGILAAIDNYDNFGGSILIGTKTFPIVPSGKREDQNMIGRLAESIVHTINSPWHLDGQMAAFYDKTKIIWQRSQHTMLRDSMVLLAEELGDLPSFNELLLPGGITTFPPVPPLISPGKVAQWGPYGAHIRAAYDQSRDQLSRQASLETIGRLQQSYYLALVRGAKELLRSEKRMEGLTTVAYALSLLASLKRIMRYLYPREAAVGALDRLLINNWKDFTTFIEPKKAEELAPLILS